MKNTSHILYYFQCNVMKIFLIFFLLKIKTIIIFIYAVFDIQIKNNCIFCVLKINYFKINIILM